MDNARKALPFLGHALLAEETLQRAELVLHLTQWPQFREIGPARARSLVSRPRIVDGRGSTRTAGPRRADGSGCWEGPRP
jgi:UDPglucose 6-dehydrogenase